MLPAYDSFLYVRQLFVVHQQLFTHAETSTEHAHLGASSLENSVSQSASGSLAGQDPDSNTAYGDAPELEQVTQAAPVRSAPDDGADSGLADGPEGHQHTQLSTSPAAEAQSLEPSQGAHGASEPVLMTAKPTSSSAAADLAPAGAREQELEQAWIQPGQEAAADPDDGFGAFDQASAPLQPRQHSENTASIPAAAQLPVSAHTPELPEPGLIAAQTDSDDGFGAFDEAPEAATSATGTPAPAGPAVQAPASAVQTGTAVSGSDDGFGSFDEEPAAAETPQEQPAPAGLAPGTPASATDSSDGFGDFDDAPSTPQPPAAAQQDSSADRTDAAAPAAALAPGRQPAEVQQDALSLSTPAFLQVCMRLVSLHIANEPIWQSGLSHSSCNLLCMRQNLALATELTVALPCSWRSAYWRPWRVLHCQWTSTAWPELARRWTP